LDFRPPEKPTQLLSSCVRGGDAHFEQNASLAIGRPHTIHQALESLVAVESPTEKPWKGALSKEKVGLIRSSYQEVIEKITGPGFEKEFYTVLFDTVPEAKALFKQK
jgi:hypothetical protein